MGLGLAILLVGAAPTTHAQEIQFATGLATFADFSRGPSGAQYAGFDWGDGWYLLNGHLNPLPAAELRRLTLSGTGSTEVRRTDRAEFYFDSIDIKKISDQKNGLELYLTVNYIKGSDTNGKPLFGQTVDTYQIDFASPIAAYKSSFAGKITSFSIATERAGNGESTLTGSYFAFDNLAYRASSTPLQTTPPSSVVPEPSNALMLLAGLVAMGSLVKRRKSRA